MATETKKTSVTPNGHTTQKFLDNMPKPAFNGKRTPVDLVKDLIKLPADELDEESKTAIHNWAKEKVNLPKKPEGKKGSSKKPGKVYDLLFSGKSLSPEQMLRQSINTTPHFAPQSVIGLLQKKIKGAQTRIVNRRNAIQEFRYTLKSGKAEKNGKEVFITPSEKKSIQQKKLHAEAELIKAKDDMALFRQNLAEALAKNGDPLRADIRSVRESAYIRRMAPSVSKQILQYVESKTGVREQLINLKRDTPAEEVSDGFLNIVKDGNDKAYKLLVAKPKLATRVKQVVYEKLSQIK